MLITENIAVKVRKKRAVKQLGKVELSKKIRDNTTHSIKN